jgi:hypothetical protein
MEIRLRSTGQVMTESEFRAAHPNTSFPQQLTVELLDGFDADPVLNGAQPSAGRYQTVARDGVEEVNGKWFTKFILVDMDAEAIAAVDAQQAASVRSTRDEKLKATDWTQVDDAPVDKATWATYRQVLRDIPAQTGFPWDITWPVEP